MCGCRNSCFLPWLILLMWYGFYTLASRVVKCDGAWQVARGVQKSVMSILPTCLSEKLNVVLWYTEEARFTGMSMSSFTLVLLHIILYICFYFPSDFVFAFCLLGLSAYWLSFVFDKIFLFFFWLFLLKFCLILALLFFSDWHLKIKRLSRTMENGRRAQARLLMPPKLLSMVRASATSAHCHGQRSHAARMASQRVLKPFWVMVNLSMNILYMIVLSEKY